MALFSNLFKKPQPPTLEQQIASVKDCSETQLLAIINSDAAEALKVAAIRQLPYSENLLTITTSTPAHRYETQARKRLGELLDSGEVKVEALSQKIQNQPVLLTLCGYSSNAGAAVVAEIDNQDILVDIAKTAATTGIRQAAAEKISQYEHLQDLQKVAKVKDKSVYKIVKTKLDVFKIAQADQKKRDQSAQALCAQAEQLHKRDVDDVFHVLLTQVQSAWHEATGKIDSAIAQRFNHAMAINAEKVTKLDAEIAEKKLLEQAEQAAKKDILLSITNVKATLAELFTPQGFSEEEFAATKGQLEQQQQAHAEAVSQASARGLNTKKEQHQFSHLIQNASGLIAKLEHTAPIGQLIEELKAASEQSGKNLKKSLSSVLDHARALSTQETPEVVQKAKDAINEWSGKIKNQNDAVRASVDQSFDLIRKGFGAINGGQVRRAKAISSDLAKTIDKLDALPPNLEAKYEDFKAALNKLGDWHEFAVTPKKTALIETMQGLANTALQPKDLADKIKALQEQWRELSRGGQSNDDSLWQQFQLAGQQAYEPCKTYFEQQSSERERNAENRQQLIEQLQEYLKAYDWDNANWKEVEKTLRVAREAWQSYWPVGRKQNKPLQETFEALTDNLYGKIGAEYERNRVKKQAIVDEAKALAEHTDTADAIEKAKQLQTQWQSTGRCKAKVDQELWRDFRAACDAIFDKRKQESQAESQQRNQSKLEAEDILTRLEAVLTETGEAFFSAKSTVPDVINQFKGLGEFPRSHYKALHQRFDKFVDQLEKRVEQERKQAQWQMWLSLLRANKNLGLLEWAYAHQEDTSALQSEIQAALSEAARWPSQIVAALQARLEAASSFNADTTGDNLRALQILCIRSEIINDVATDEDNKALRMEYQVEQLKQGLGTQRQASDNSIESILSAWVDVKATQPQAYENTELRLLTVWGFKPPSSPSQPQQT